MGIKKVGVVGCGLMGGGISLVSAQSGYQTVVSEANEELLNKGISAIKGILSRNVEKGRMSKEDEEATLSRLKGTTDMQAFCDCDLVIEAVTENMDLKKKIFATLDGVCPPHAILASNTSCLSVIDLAMVTKRPDKVAGTHFFSPVPVMKLLELVRTIVSSDETIETLKSFGESLGKTVIIAKDTPGFIVNLLLTPYLLDAVRALEAGVATKEDIDAGMELGCNYPMGPLRLADFVGVDVFYFVAEAMYEEFKDPRYAAPPLMRKMVAAGRLGRKTGEGFYSYK